MNQDFSFLRCNRRDDKPRSRGITEVRGPYYAPVGRHYLEDLLADWGAYVDALKFAGGSFTLMPRDRLRDVVELAHRHGVLVSTGGFIEYVLTQGESMVDRYIGACREAGFDILEISAGFVTLPTEDWIRLVKAAARAGLKPKPEVGIQFGAGGASAGALLESEGQRAVDWAIAQAQRLVEAGAYQIMIESEGITESVTEWRTDAVARIVDALGLEKVMFEAADPAVFTWYVKNYGPDVNLFVDHSQIVQLETLRRGLWGAADVWGRVVTYRDRSRARGAT
jgi:phosphosulfolactate synthase (CoM biosynthesis protein A)